jgi:hypothetical protein
MNTPTVAPASAQAIILRSLALIALLGVPALADTVGSGPCNSSTPVNGAVCQQTFYYDRNTPSGQSSVTIPYTPASYSDGYIMTIYVYNASSNNVRMTMTFGTNVNSPDTCFIAAPGNPSTVNPGPVGGVYYVWFCSKLTATSGVTSLTMTCTPNSGSCG